MINETHVYQTLFEEMSDGVYVTDADGRIAYFNNAALTIFGYEQSEMRCQPIRQLFANEEEIPTLLTLLQEQRRVEDYAVKGRRKDGTTIDCTLTTTLQYDENGRISSFLAIIRDISHTRRTEQALTNRLRLEAGIAAASRALVNDVATSLEKALMHLLTATDVNRICVYANVESPEFGLCMKRLHRIHAPDANIPKKSATHPELVPYDAGLNRWRQRFEEGREVTGSKSEMPVQERAMLEAQGVESMLGLPIFVKEVWQGFICFDTFGLRERWSEEDIQLLQTSADIIGSYLERQNAARALKEQETFLNLVINSIPQAIFWKDRNSVYMGGNQPFAKDAGVSSVHELVGKTDHDLAWKKEEADFFRQVDQEVMLENRPQMGIIEPMLNAQGQEIWLETNKIPLADSTGQVIGILGTYDVVTERLQAQKQVEDLLEQRRRQVVLSTQIAQDIATSSDLNILYQRVVDQVKEQFNYYHVQLLRHDPALDNMALVVGYGEIGEKMLAMNHAMPIGVGIIGTAAVTGRSVLQPDVSNEPHWRPNALLPGTKGELAVPIKLRNEVIGVLDIQSDQLNALSEEDQIMLEGLCGQIAIAIESTNLRHNLETQVVELLQLQRRLSQEGWDFYANKTRKTIPGFVFDQGGVRALPMAVAETQSSPNQKNGNASFASPLNVRGKMIGNLQVQKDAQRPLSTDETEFLTAVSKEIADALETARLFEETQIALAGQERLASELETVAQVSMAASTILEIDSLLQSVVDLAKESFRLYHIHIYLYDEARQMLVLRAGSGNPGRLMVLEGHDIHINAESLVARAARKEQGVLENDVRKTIDFMPNPLLPKTQAELAVPMIVGNKLVGVLDLHAATVDLFSEEDLKIHTTLAAQIAIAVENARQYAEQVETAQKLREVDILKSEFLASMSHELRTPLNSIIGFADVMLEGLDGQLNDRMEEDVRLIRDSGSHLRELIGEILDMSKIESGKMDLRYEAVSLQDLAHGIMATAQPLAHEKKLVLNLEIDDDLPLVEADKTRIRQVLWNMMGNAIKFTPQGSITLRMQARKDHVLVSVQDSGIGIKPEHVPIVFEQFRQIDGGVGRIAGGAGLGMPISKKLVELHGGDIWVESQMSQGSTFFFTLPYKRPLIEPETQDY